MPQRLHRLDIDLSRPGFYDEPTFLAAEREDPTLLEAYAAHVDALALDAGYIHRAEETIRRTASFLVDELRADGRKGACVDMSMTLSRFLERQGIWNYIVKGACSLTFGRETGIKPKHFWPITVGPSASVAAHVWVKAPPFKVLDLTLPFQPYSAGEERYLLEPILATDGQLVDAVLEDLLDPSARRLLAERLKRPLRLEDVGALDSALLDRCRSLGGVVVALPQVNVKYVACATSAPDASLERSRNLCLRGRYPIDLWNEYEARLTP